MKAIFLERIPLYMKFIRERKRSGKVMISHLFSENDGKVIFNNSSSN